MSKRPKKLLERREGVIGTARWLEADLHRAELSGSSGVLVKIQDLRELVGFIIAIERVQIAESSKVKIGYCRKDQLLEMKAHKLRSIKTIICKTADYDTEVYIDRMEVAITETQAARDTQPV